MQIREIMNIERLEMELGDDINIEHDKLELYLAETGLNPRDKYNPEDRANLIDIYRATLSILESVANNQSNMEAEYGTKDYTIQGSFYDNLLERIDYLYRKIQSMQQSMESEKIHGNSIGYLFTE